MDYEAERARHIKELESLWRETTGKDLRAFDKAINTRFEVKDGRDALAFESIKQVREGLIKLKGKKK